MKSPTRYFFSINEPCTENWNQMLPDEKGRFCLHCNKSVIDFTSLSDEEIIRLIAGKKEEKICGQFRTDQLNRWIEESNIKTNNPAIYKIALSLLMLTASLDISAQKNAELKFLVEAGSFTYTKDSLIAFSGRLKDTVGNPLPGAEIRNSQNGKIAWTDQDGTFSITGQVGDSIQFSRNETCLEKIPVLNCTIQPPPGIYLKQNGIDRNTVVRIGGVSSIRSDEKPIYVIDDKICSAKALEKIDPNNIKKIEILRGPEATALYGSKAQNGAIVMYSKNPEKKSRKKR